MRDPFRTTALALLAALPVLAIAPAASADPSSRDIDRMTARSDAAMAAISLQESANLAALEMAGEAERTIRQCVDTATTAVAKNLGDLSEAELRGVRRCIADALEALAAKMQALKAMARNTAFDYSAFAETVRLLVSTDDPVSAAVEPMRAMLRAADAAAAGQTEKAVTLRLVQVMNDLGQRFEPAKA